MWRSLPPRVWRARREAASRCVGIGVWRGIRFLRRIIGCAWPRLRRRRLPAAGLAFVLLLEPFLQRREVLEHRRAVDLLAAGHLIHRLLPRLARALVQHRPDLLPGNLLVLEAAFVQLTLVAGRVAPRLVELELQAVGEEVDRKSVV